MIQSDKIKLKVSDIETITPTLKKISLVAADGAVLPITSPGSHLIVELPCARKTLKNAYSIITPVRERNKYQIIVRKSDESRGGSVYIHENLKIGDEIHANAPVSLFAPANIARKYLLISAGIGITPILSILAALRERGANYEFHQIIKAPELDAFKALIGDANDYRATFHIGHKDINLSEILGTQPLGTHLYFCGPQSFIDAVQDAAHENGWPDVNVHYESFGGAGGEPFDIKIASSGQIIKVDETETMLEALERAEIDIPSLCRGGACGVCATKVKDGEIEHRDHYLSDDEKHEGKTIMPCVSRGKSACITLDI